MFDKHVHVRGGDQHHHHSATITEKRAPTDESVKLLREMEAAALDKLLASVRLESCEVSCVLHYQRHDITDEDRFVIQYQLGRTAHRIRHDAMRSYGTLEEVRKKMAEELVRVLAEDIAQRILAAPFAKAMFRIPL